MSHPAFALLRREHIPSLNIQIEEYRHRVTGARHFHMVADDNNNAFLVAFLTVPQDSSGVAHILEHTVLCGSERFPVRDPFFMMIRRSLNTFMNAFTSSDWTAYPFASQNRRDFDNLLQVYLDAVFFPRLHELDFAQEGHRVEFAAAGDPDSPLVYKGVVYNEMKGAMSSPVRRVAQSLQSHLFPTTTYHYNSGGEPEVIPELTYEQLRDFHRRHYHPSNALFMTYGNFPVDEHQARIEELALSHFQPLDLDLSIPDERRYQAPVTVQAAYPVDRSEGLARKTHVLLGWLLGHSADLREIMNAQLLSGVLLDHSASPLRRALETTDLGTSPSELCGLDDSTREASFACGLEGSEPERAQAVEALVLEVLQQVAEHGVPQEQVESVLHQLELSQREIGGGRFPYGLQLMVRALAATLYGGDPVAVLNLDPVLNELRASIADPDYIKSLVRRLLLENPHRVRLTVVPDPELGARMEAEEEARLAALGAQLDAAERARVMAQSATLKARQEAEDDPELLPKVGLADVPAELRIPEGAAADLAGLRTTWYTAGTNGLVYEQVVAVLPSLDDELRDELPLFCDCLTEVGCGERDYLQTQARQAAATGGISAKCSVRGDIHDVQQLRGLFSLGGKALVRNQGALAELLRETFERARFDELARLRELVAQIRAGRETSVTDHGHVLALSAASASIAPYGALLHRWDGLQGLRRLKALDDALVDATALAAFAARLARLRDAVLSAPRQYVLVGEADHQDAIQTALGAHWADAPAASMANRAFVVPTAGTLVREAWTTSTQVSFCAKAYPSVAQDHPDSAALTVLGPFLRNGFLHRVIREQGGAYGGGAGYDSDTGAFRFYSYRDPRLGETLADFDRALLWLQEERHEMRELEEAILGVVGDIDRPSSPAGEALSAFYGELHGRSASKRREFRQRVLGVTLDDLLRVAARYLRPEQAHIAVVTDAKLLAREPQLELEVRSL